MKKLPSFLSASDCLVFLKSVWKLARSIKMTGSATCRNALAWGRGTGEGFKSSHCVCCSILQGSCISSSQHTRSSSRSKMVRCGTSHQLTCLNIFYCHIAIPEYGVIKGHVQSYLQYSGYSKINLCYLFPQSCWGLLVVWWYGHYFLSFWAHCDNKCLVTAPTGWVVSVEGAESVCEP